jgi:hypothetical protein
MKKDIVKFVISMIIFVTLYISGAYLFGWLK